jgi:fluoride exporter
MRLFFLVCLAGAIGTGARYGVGLWAGRTFGAGFPYGTFIVNVVGCFLIALVYQLALTGFVSPTMRTTLMSGFMGGLTTYSAFNNDTTLFMQERAWAFAFLNVALTLFVCFGAGLLGFAVARRIGGP